MNKNYEAPNDSRRDRMIFLRSFTLAFTLTAFFAFGATAQTLPDAHATGLPVIRIDTKGNAEIASKETYVNMDFRLEHPDNRYFNVATSGMTDSIRVRGNASFFDPYAIKKSYRIKFSRSISLFGLAPAKNWVLIAQYRDPTLLFNAVAFELGNRFAMPFNHTYRFAELYINGEYMGNYLLTEHNQVGSGRVDIDESEGWMIELDERYDEGVRFRTANYGLPVVIKSPEFTPANIENPGYDFVIRDWNELTGAVANPSFPESGYRDMINMETFIDYMMITEITNERDFRLPLSVFMYKDKGGAVSMGPLWDFDCGYGYDYDQVFFNRYGKTEMHTFFERFFEDPVFRVKYKLRWKEMYDDIVTIPDFIDSMANMLERSAKQNFKRWWYKSLAPYTDEHPYEENDFRGSVSRLKDWYKERIAYLNDEFDIDRVDVFPTAKTFSPLTAGYLADAVQQQTFTIVSKGKMSDLRANLRGGTSSGFAITVPIKQTPMANGWYFATVTVKHKHNLRAAAYGDTLTLEGENQGKRFTLAVPLNITIEQPSPTRFALVASPAPARREDRAVKFFRTGNDMGVCPVIGGTITIYDAMGNTVRKIDIRDEFPCRPLSDGEDRRVIGEWDLSDASGRTVVKGTYMARGVINIKGNKRQRVSTLISVR